MNFEFAIFTHGFEKAAKLEAELKKLGIAFEVKQAKPVSNAPKKRRRLSKTEVMAVSVTCADHPDWDDKAVANHSGVGRNTVNRIRRGIHPQQGATKLSEVKA